MITELIRASSLTIWITGAITHTRLLSKTTLLGSLSLAKISGLMGTALVASTEMGIHGIQPRKATRNPADRCRLYFGTYPMLVSIISTSKIPSCGA